MPSCKQCPAGEPQQRQPPSCMLLLAATLACTLAQAPPTTCGAVTARCRHLQHRRPGHMHTLPCRWARSCSSCNHPPICMLAALAAALQPTPQPPCHAQIALQALPVPRLVPHQRPRARPAPPVGRGGSCRSAWLRAAARGAGGIPRSDAGLDGSPLCPLPTSSRHLR